MGRVLIVYFSLTGRTQLMAEYIAEGVRFETHKAVTKKTAEIGTAKDIEDYDGYIFGSPTHHQDIPGQMKTFLSLVRVADLKGKPGAAFGSYTHSGDAPALLFDTMTQVLGMSPFYLGPFNLLEAKLDTPDGMKACHDYGRTFGEKLSESRIEDVQGKHPEPKEKGEQPGEGPDSPPPWALT
jgi:flavorubredoxin